MNILKCIKDIFNPPSGGKVTPPFGPPPMDYPENVVEVTPKYEFRVVTHYSGSRYYVLQYKGKCGWHNVTKLYQSSSGDYDDLNHPVLGYFDELVEMGKKFKEDPASYESFKQRQIDRYNERASARRETIKKHDEKVQYI